MDFATAWWKVSGSTDLALLRRVAEGRETSEDRAALAGRLRVYLSAPASVTLDGVFGLTRSARGLPWWRAEALDRRDAAIRALASRFYSGRSVASQAAAIHRVLLRYSASAWRFDRREPAPPVHYLGRADEMMFDAMRACDSVPSVRHLRRVLRP